MGTWWGNLNIPTCTYSAGALLSDPAYYMAVPFPFLYGFVFPILTVSCPSLFLSQASALGFSITYQ